MLTRTGSQGLPRLLFPTRLPIGGGHRFPGPPGKSPFPQDWSDANIMHEVSDAATDPNLQGMKPKGKPWVSGDSLFTKKGAPARFPVWGVRDGVRTKVVVEPADEGIITGVPD